MNYRINNLHRPIDSKPEAYEAEIEKITGLKAGDYTWRRHRESVDARKGRTMRFTAAVDIITDKKVRKNKQILPVREKPYDLSPIETAERPVVVGAGPAGLFCAWVLAKRGMAPILLERGDAVEDRVKKVEAFWETGELDPESNVQFGEGGAGTFSDGKLTSRSKDPRGRTVLELFSRLAVDESILYKKKPHVGTDALRKVLVLLRKELEHMGAEIHFRTALKSITKDEEGYLLTTNSGDFRAKYVVFALGHSARDSFYMLHEKGVAMEQKPFAVGFRIEEPQAAINESQYGDMCRFLPAADYSLTAKVEEKGVYTFCMCPGGKVVAAASEEGGVVTNGMSYKARDGENANAAVLVTVDHTTYGEGVLAGVEFQREIERKVFAMTNSYKAPVESASSYLYGEKTAAVTPTYKPGTFFADLHTIYSEELDRALTEGLKDMGRRFPALIEKALLTAPETRSSSPVRITRDSASLESISHENLYPAGEGAGYAGGIVSSAMDGMRVAEKIIEKEKNHVRN
ncbi:NAD(P)/FAD-dependent oxidoreductase [Aedoeadaptatus acetigenes]|uniref:NAD(P)/FAD-dependent oxidoreductase n=1 Tax=Aedoeadaptatus acetigenes TaxID=2981723 RepID=UPI0011DE15A2|nr:NAD(P)-binding protein [Aedoeadaptatus acetigenes]MCU6786030.1 NAD(P)-binding protein [Aedoeadaptatus acetigenes]